MDRPIPIPPPCAGAAAVPGGPMVGSGSDPSLAVIAHALRRRKIDAEAGAAALRGPGTGPLPGPVQRCVTTGDSERRRQGPATAGVRERGRSAWARGRMGPETAPGGAPGSTIGRLHLRPGLRKGAPRQRAVLRPIRPSREQRPGPNPGIGAPIAGARRESGTDAARRRVGARAVRLPGFGRPRLRQGPVGQGREVGFGPAITLLFLMNRQYRRDPIMVVDHVGLVRSQANPVLVMYRDQITESEAINGVFGVPDHPCTRALPSAAPAAGDWSGRVRITVEAAVRRMLDPPSAPVLRTRNRRKRGAIRGIVPLPVMAAEPGHVTRCHIPLDELRAIEPVVRKAAR